MNHHPSPHPASPLLNFCPPSLPARSYFDEAWFLQEQKNIWAKNWAYVGRANDFKPMTMRRLSVAGQNIILIKDRDGAITSFHNTCRHRGSELCTVAERDRVERQRTQDRKGDADRLERIETDIRAMLDVEAAVSAGIHLTQLSRFLRLPSLWEFVTKSSHNTYTLG